MQLRFFSRGGEARVKAAGGPEPLFGAALRNRSDTAQPRSRARDNPCFVRPRDFPKSFVARTTGAPADLTPALFQEETCAGEIITQARRTDFRLKRVYELREVLFNPVRILLLGQD